MGYRNDLTGVTFGDLTCIGFDCNKGKYKVAYWNVKCKCGKEYSISGGNLKSQTTKCKSCSIKKIAQSRRTGTEDIRGLLFRHIVYNAKRRGHEFNLSLEFMDKLLKSQNFRCALSNLPIHAGYDYDGDPGKCASTKKWTASLDRIDSSKGYIEGNVQWVHKDINWMKQDYSKEEFINYCKLVSENNK